MTKRIAKTTESQERRIVVEHNQFKESTFNVDVSHRDAGRLTAQFMRMVESQSPSKRGSLHIGLEKCSGDDDLNLQVDTKYQIRFTERMASEAAKLLRLDGIKREKVVQTAD